MESCKWTERRKNPLLVSQTYVYTTIKKLVLPKNEIKSPQVLGAWKGLHDYVIRKSNIFFSFFEPFIKKTEFWHREEQCAFWTLKILSEVFPRCFGWPSATHSPPAHSPIRVCRRSINPVQRCCGVLYSGREAAHAAVNAASTNSLGMHLFLEVIAIPVTACRWCF